MKVYDSKKIRNVAVCGASGAGKTQLVESILFKEKIINRLGKVEEGNTVSDNDEIEKERKSSINSSLISFESGDKKINIIDTPGYADFYGNVISAVDVSEVVLLVINPHEEIDVVTRKVWNRAKKQKKPVIVFINFMDNSPKEFNELVSMLKEKLSPNMAPVTAPLGRAENFKGIIKLLERIAVKDGKESDIPEEFIEKTKDYSENLMDSVAAADDNLMEKYLEKEKLEPEEISDGLTSGLLKGEIVPVLCGSSVNTMGISELTEFIKKYTPSPLGIEHSIGKVESEGPFRGLVFKVESQRHLGQVSCIKIIQGSLKKGDYVYNLQEKSKNRVNQVSVKRGEEIFDVDKANSGDLCALVKIEDIKVNDTLAQDQDTEPIKPIGFPKPVVDRGVYPKSKGDQEKVAKAFSNIIKEDPTLDFGYNKETKEMVLTGMGTLQLELIVKKIRNRYDAQVDLTTPRIAYKETARNKVDKVQGKYKKQTGGRGQYGDCIIRLEPLERGKGFEFVDEIVGGRIPSNYIPAVEKGIVDAMGKGVIAGYPVVDIRVALFDGSYHDVDSSDMAFQVAGSMAFQKAMQKAQPYILEPIMKVGIKVTNDYTGTVMGDLNSRRGRVLGMEPGEGEQVINALIPKSGLTTFAEDLRSLTSGEGEYTVEFDHYEEAPMDVQQSLIEKYKKEREEGR